MTTELKDEAQNQNENGFELDMNEILSVIGICTLKFMSCSDSPMLTS